MEVLYFKYVKNIIQMITKKAFKYDNENHINNITTAIC